MAKYEIVVSVTASEAEDSEAYTELAKDQLKFLARRVTESYKGHRSHLTLLVVDDPTIREVQ